MSTSSLHQEIMLMKDLVNYAWEVQDIEATRMIDGYLSRYRETNNLHHQDLIRIKTMELSIEILIKAITRRNRTIDSPRSPSPELPVWDCVIEGQKRSKLY